MQTSAPRWGVSGRITRRRGARQADHKFATGPGSSPSGRGPKEQRTGVGTRAAEFTVARGQEPPASTADAWPTRAALGCQGSARRHGHGADGPDPTPSDAGGHGRSRPPPACGSGHGPERAAPRRREAHWRLAMGTGCGMRGAARRARPLNETHRTPLAWAASYTLKRLISCYVNFISIFKKMS